MDRLKARMREVLALTSDVLTIALGAAVLVGAAAGVVAEVASLPAALVTLVSIAAFGLALLTSGLLMRMSGHAGSATAGSFDAAIRENVTAFYPSRRDYVQRTGASSIDDYVGQARESLLMISITLATGVMFDALIDKFAELLGRTPVVAVSVSLLDHRQAHLMNTIAPVLDATPAALARQIADTADRLTAFRGTLPPQRRTQFELRLHGALPSASAILIDHRSPLGRIQLESKPYKSPLRSSYAFEVRRGSEFYRNLVHAYETLWSEAQPLP